MTPSALMQYNLVHNLSWYKLIDDEEIRKQLEQLTRRITICAKEYGAGDTVVSLEGYGKLFLSSTRGYKHNGRKDLWLAPISGYSFFKFKVQSVSNTNNFFELSEKFSDSKIFERNVVGEEWLRESNIFVSWIIKDAFWMA